MHAGGNSLHVTNCDASLLEMVYFSTEAFSAGVQVVDAQLCAKRLIMSYNKTLC